MSGSKGIDLLMADKVAKSDEKSVEALDSWPSYDGPSEKSAGQESVEELNHGFFHFSDRYPNGYTDNRDLIGTWIERRGRVAQTGTNHWFGAHKRFNFKFRHQKVSRQYIQTGGTLTYAGARSAHWVRFNLGLSTPMQYGRWLFPVSQTNAQRNVPARVEMLFHLERPFQRSSMNATGSASGNGGRL
jgi:hypothetical protein